MLKRMGFSRLDGPGTSGGLTWALSLWMALVSAGLANAQEQAPTPALAPADDGQTPPELQAFDPVYQTSPDLQRKEQALIERIDSPQIILPLNRGLAKLMRTRLPVSRIAIANPNVVEVVQYSPNELEFIGRDFGVTTVNLWFGEGLDQPTLNYLVQVGPGRGRRFRDEQREYYYTELEARVNALFPNSSIQLIPVLDRLIVRGEARDPQEAQQITSFLQQNAPTDPEPGEGGTAIDPSEGEADIGNAQIINQVTVPGETNIMLKVRIAELSRSAIRQLGINFNVNQPNFSYSANFGVQPNVTATFDGGELTLLLEAFENNGTIKVLAEPNLVVQSGGTASFIAGGAFAVPTVVGLGGVGAAGTSFRGIGTQLSFSPVLIDKDRVQLQVATSFSTVNNALSVAGIPGTNNRAVQTIVDLREGQWMAIGGLLQDQQSSAKSRLPLVGNLPIVDLFFSTKNVTREETEVIIMVSPELVRPIDPENVPLLLPGMDVTEPTDWDLYVRSRWEGRQGVHHRSTVWQEYKNRMRDSIREARRKDHFMRVEDHYLHGHHGFSR